MNQFLKNHQLNKAEIGVTDESISDWISGLQDTFSSSSHLNWSCELPYPIIGLRKGLLIYLPYMMQVWYKHWYNKIVKMSQAMTPICALREIAAGGGEAAITHR